MGTVEFWVERPNEPDETAIHCDDAEELRCYALHFQQESIPYEIHGNKISVKGLHATMLFERCRANGQIPGERGRAH